MSQNVIVIPYDPTWPKRFWLEEKKIKEALGDNCVTIHHIGSTSIPGLSAKPIIDMLPVVKDILAVNSQALENLGYRGRGELGMPFRRYFSNHVYHLHIWEEGHPEIDRHLLFLEYLRKYPEELKRYEDLKLQLAKKFPEDRSSYTASKYDLIQDMVKKSGFEGLTMVEALLNQEWDAYHRIRKTLLFEPRGVQYDPHHPSITAENHYNFVLMRGTDIIGAIAVELLDNERAALRSLVIDTPYQNRGYGDKFLRMIERWILHQNRTKIVLHSVPQAVSFYKRAGYLEEPFNEVSANPNKNAIDLAKILSR